mgnify:CR=1 FL=1
MKKAKRLIAILLAAVMLMSAAFLPAYAKTTANFYNVPKIASNQKYYFSPQQGAGWLLDMLDEMLGEANMKFNLPELANISEGTFKFAGVNLESIDWTLNLTSVDNLVLSLDVALEQLEDAWLGSLASGLGLLGDVLKEKGLKGAYRTLDSSLKRGTRANNYSDGGSDDLEILFMLINWLDVEVKHVVANIAAGDFEWGILDSVLPANIMDILGDLDGFLKLTLYQLLADENATELPTNTSTPVDDAVQQLINWALITGTNPEAGGMTSILGPDFEAFLPAIADQPGGANIKGVSIEVDRNGDGVMETKTMSFYQLVANAIRALLDGMLAPMLGDIIADLVGVEITEQFPNGDPAIFEDVMFNTILGAVESLAEQNGAPNLEYTEEQNATPMGKINALMDWFFNDGGLDTFISIRFEGISLTDNFMSLLGDLARLAINLLPGLIGGDMFEGAEDIAYTAEELNVIRYYKENASGGYATCAADDEGAIGETYVTYEAGEILYAADWDEKTGAPTAYNYISNSKPVNTVDPSASDYRNISLIRPNYEITTDMVYACLIKMLLNGLIDGCYWPEWTTDIPTVLAYAMAALAVPTVPEGNFFARLDAYHQTGGIAPVADANGVTVDPIPYYTVKNGIEVPTGALNIGGAVAAFYLNAIFTFDDAERLTEVGTTFERFVTEFLLWAADEYLPMLVGDFNADTNRFEGNGIWVSAINNLVTATYSDRATGTAKSDANWDAVYTFLDATLLKLIPAGWLPGINSSFDLFNGWLLNNLLHFDLQGILSLFSINPDESSELHQPLLTVLLRIVDRVLGLVLNGTPVLPGYNRTGADSNGVALVFKENTTITSLDALIDASSTSAPLPMLVTQLITGLNANKTGLLSMVLPLIMGGAYNKPYDKEFDASGTVTDNNWLGTDMTTYKIADLETYIGWFQDDANAVRGTTYATEEEAEAAITDTKLQYIKAEGTGTFDEEENEIYTYTVYTQYEYYTHGADETMITETSEDGQVSTTIPTYNNFRYSKLDFRKTDRPYVMYEDLINIDNPELRDYRFYAVEDWKTTPYAYHNLKQALKKADEYIGTYESFAENDLGAAYAEWQRYFIQTRLYSADLLDTNGDGRCVISESDSDYVAATDNDPGFPVDGMPSIPTAMLPYSTTDGNTYTQYTYLDSEADAYHTVYPTTFTRQQYEQLDIALKLGEDVKNNVPLDNEQAEEVVRLALSTRGFDITVDANGNYDAGSIQWEGLSAAQLSTITDFCASLKYKFTYDLEANTYEISRPAFRLIDGSYVLGCGVDANPPMALSMAESPTYAQENDDQMYKSYVDYMHAMYDNRKNVYNHIDYISDRAEELASFRTNDQIDTTMLKWALNLPQVKNAFRNNESGLLNWKISGVNEDGSYYYVKDYTQASYDEFAKAYQYAYCINEASTGAIQSRGLTQSMVSAAFQALLKAYQGLVKFTGAADWTQLDEYLAFAEGIYNDPNKFDDELGYTVDSFNNLIAEWEAAKLVRENEQIDCERQQEVDATAAALLTAINNLVYNSVPKIVPAIEGVLTEITSAQGANRTMGHVFGLEEGTGITLDLIGIIGMRLDEGIGNTVTVEDSGKGSGTGAYYKGTVGNLEKFRFYAVIYGDINGDTRIDGTDRTSLDLYILQGANNSAEPDAGGMGSIKFEAGDVNHDGKVDAEDSYWIELHYNYSEDENYEIDQGTHSPSAAQVAA